MNDNRFDEDIPTQPLPPLPPKQSQQGQMIVGSFREDPKPRERRPYRYQPLPPSEERPAPLYPYQRQGAGSAQPVPHSSGLPNAHEPPTMPLPSSNPSVRRPPGFEGPGQMASIPAFPNAKPKANKPRVPFRRRRGCQIGCLSVVVLFVLFGCLGAYVLQKVLAFGSSISTQSPLSSQTGYMGTTDRVNLLVLGYGGGMHDGANLTDSLVVMSLLPQSHHTTLLSVPRDLWVQVPTGSGQYHKINTVYESASNNGVDHVAGADAAVKKVSAVIGLDVKYWLLINFQGFRDFIDSIGGVDVAIPDSFTARYPKNDDPNVNASWIVIHFTKGMEHMNGERAIEYARARYVLDNTAEGSDFARSVRQQIIIKAALSKVKQIPTWFSLFNALNALQNTLYSNLSLADLAQFALKMDLTDAHHIGLSNQNVLVDVNEPDGEAALEPTNGNWQGIVDYVKRNLYT